MVTPLTTSPTVSAGRSVFLTGATGLVGSEILRRYATAPGVQLYALIRADSEAELRRRFQNLLAALDLQPTQASCITPIRGDITRPDLGLEPAVAERVRQETTDVIHCATEVNFGRPLEQARAVNLLGIVNLMEQVRRWPCAERIVHVSTVQVAGKRTGLICEDELVHTAGFVNTYEQSKYEAEVYLQGLMADLPIAIYRCSGVVGDSRTGRVRQFNWLHQAVRLLSTNLLPVFPGDPDLPADLIPIDWLADALVYLINQHFEPGRTYHLAAGRFYSLPLGDLVEFTLRCLEQSPFGRIKKLRRPEIIDLATFEALRQAETSRKTRHVRALHDMMHDFIPQWFLPKVFDQKNMCQALAASGMAVPALDTYYQRIIDYCLLTRWGRASVLEFMK